jgi:hypothetical protein
VYGCFQEEIAFEFFGRAVLDVQLLFDKTKNYQIVFRFYITPARKDFVVFKE